MKIEVFPLDFMGQGALIEPRDKKLFDMAVEYCKRELENGSEVNLAGFSKVWVSVAVDDKCNPVEVCGITGFVMKPDIPMFRVSGKYAARATKMMTDRYHAYFADNGGRGTEVFIHISGKETPEQRCNRWEESLQATNAKPADRFSIIVK